MPPSLTCRYPYHRATRRPSARPGSAAPGRRSPSADLPTAESRTQPRTSPSWERCHWPPAYLHGTARLRQATAAAGWLRLTERERPEPSMILVRRCDHDPCRATTLVRIRLATVVTARMPTI